MSDNLHTIDDMSLFRVYLGGGVATAPTPSADRDF